MVVFERSQRPHGRRKALFRWVASVPLLLAASCGESPGEGTDTDCAPGQRDCGECATLASDLENCGQCGNACGTGQACVNGSCRCDGALTACGPACADLASDPQNCGRCGNVCTGDMVCSNGACSTSCAQGLERCGMSCVALASSMLHCGQCDQACGAGQSCAGGACACTDGRALCAGSCSDISTDTANCGRCGNACVTGTTCVNGSCQAQGAGGSAGAGAQGGAAGAPGGGTGAGTSSAGASGAGGAGGGAAGGSGGSGGSGAGGSSPGCDATGFHVRDGALYDVNCNEFVMRGVNYPYTWFSTRNTQQDLAAIGATGANAVRLVLSTGGRWTRTPAGTLTSLVEWSKAAGLVAIVEVHDTTGYSEQSGSVALSNATEYWTSSDIAAALRGQEAYVIVNVGNEPNGNDTTASWVTSHVTAVQALRTAGYEHTLMVDAPNWGQDWQNTMRDGGGAPIWDADPRKNLVFSVHMYDVYGTSSTITSYFNTFLSEYEAPLVVGEFAADHGASGNVDEDTLMSLAENLSIGYLGWSWSGNSGDLSSLDITSNFDANSLTTWGTRLINGANGIDATSERCTCFD